jgi:hypothetical protein
MSRNDRTTVLTPMGREQEKEFDVNTINLSDGEDSKAHIQ